MATGKRPALSEWQLAGLHVLVMNSPIPAADAVTAGNLSIRGTTPATTSPTLPLLATHQPATHNRNTTDTDPARGP
jgi:hypothetical protein